VAELPAGGWDVVTVLEVFEHMADPAAAARRLVRAAGRFLVATVPSHPDDNPEHLRLYTGQSLTGLLLGAGAREVRVEHVLNHLVARAATGR
jgi:2-polyprenyl-3-methyl-5-hydroxy-6-metoxy-1,4-benzoquinol methylase